MVWCASTLWAETSEGSFRQRWLAALARRGVESSSRMDGDDDGSVSRSPSPTGRSPSPRKMVERGSLRPTGENSGDEDGSGGSVRRERRENANRIRRKRALEMQQRVDEHIHRAHQLRADRAGQLEQQRNQREKHTRDVKSKMDQQIQSRVDQVKETIKTREKRFLPVIDQCETDDERDVLRSASLQVAVNAFTFVVLCQHKLRVARYMKKLQLVLGPMVRLWLRRRMALVRAYAALWRGRCARPSIATLQSVFPPLSRWSAAAVQKLIRMMKPMCAPAGRAIFTVGEPGVSAVYISSGRIAIRQRRLNAPDLELGERGATYVHGEEILTKEEQIRHYTSVIAVETVGGWYITRKAYWQCSKESAASMDIMAATAVALSSTTAAKVAEITENALRNNKVLLAGWCHEDIVALIEAALPTERNIPRGACIYRYGQRATCAFLIVRGTVLLAQQTRRATSTLTAGGDAAAGAEHHHHPSEPRHDVSGADLSDGPTNPNVGLGANTAHLNPLSCFMHAAQKLTDVDTDDFFRDYANAGQMIGFDALLLGAARSEIAFAATDCIVLELPHAAFVHGMLTDPAQLLMVQRQLNTQRASRLISPIAPDINPFMAHAAVVNFFLRNAFPFVVGRGGPLPLRQCLVFVQHGSLELSLTGGGNGAGGSGTGSSQQKSGSQGGSGASATVVLKAPCVVASEEVLTKLVRSFDGALETGSLVLVRPEKGSHGAAGSGAAAVRQSIVSKHQGANAAPKSGSVVTTRRQRGSIAAATPSTEPNGANDASSPVATPQPLDDGIVVTDVQAVPATPSSSLQPSDLVTPIETPDHTVSMKDNAASAAGAAVAPPQQQQELWGHIPLTGTMTLVVKAPYNHDVDDLVAATAIATAAAAAAGTNAVTPTSNRVRYRAATAAVQLESLTEDLLEGVPAPQHKCTTRCEVWCIRWIDLIRRFHSGTPIAVRRIEDVLSCDGIMPLRQPLQAD